MLRNKNEIILTHSGLINPFRALDPLPILNPSNFVPKRVSSGKGVKEPRHFRKWFGRMVSLVVVRLGLLRGRSIPRPAVSRLFLGGG